MGGCTDHPPGVSPEEAGRTPSAKDSRALFEDTIVPLLESRCGISCHGVPADQFVAFMNEPVNAQALYFPVDPATGRIPATPALRQMTFDVVRGVWRPEHEGNGHGAHSRIDYQAAAEFSPLLLAPLTGSFGGETHHGMDIFYDTRDPDYQRLRDWVAIEIARHPETPPALSAAETFFRDHVVGVLERNGCFLSSCHGAHVFNDLKLVRPLPRLLHEAGNQPPARLSPRMLAALRRAVLGNVTRFVNLGGDLRRSRLIVKNLPIGEGGVHQRGGNQQFFGSYEDRDVQLLLEWMALEKQQLAARLTRGGRAIAPAELGREQGVAFLRGPRHAPRRFFEFDAFWPGTRLLILAAGAAEPVAVVDEPGVEIQAFDVRYDARAIVFSMRRRAAEGFRLYEIELDDNLSPVTRTLRQISHDAAHLPDGTLIHHVDPVYIPERAVENTPGLDTALDRVAVAFASNAAGTYAQSSPWALLGEADGGDPSMILDAGRTEAAGTFEGRSIAFVAGPLAGASRTITRHGPGGRLVLDRPLGEAPDKRTVYVIEQTDPDFQSAFDIWRVVPGDWHGTARRMTFTNAQERRPTMRTSGEVMFTSVRNRGFSDGKPVFNGAIYRVQAGGWDYHIQGGNRSRHPLYADSRELPSGLEIRMALDPRNYWGGGAPFLVDHGFGVSIEPGNPMDNLPYDRGDPLETGSQRFLPAQYPVFTESGPRAVTVSGRSPGGSFRDPYPLPDGTLLVAGSAGAVDHLNPDADPDWDLYRLRFDGNRLQSADGYGPGIARLERIDVASSRAAAEYSPRPVVVRLKEKSVTHQKFAAPVDEIAPVDGVLARGGG